MAVCCRRKMMYTYIVDRTCEHRTTQITISSGRSVLGASARAFAIWIMMRTGHKYWWCFHFYRRFSHVLGCSLSACLRCQWHTDTHTVSAAFLACAMCCAVCVCTTYLPLHHPHRLINVKSACDYLVLGWTAKRFTWWWRLVVGCGIG